MNKKFKVEIDLSGEYEISVDMSKLKDGQNIWDYAYYLNKSLQRRSNRFLTKKLKK